MRLLLDESLSHRLSVPLAHAGHDVVHVVDIGLQGAADDAVLGSAVRTQRVLVTADTDFGALLALSSAPRPSVLLLRRSGRHVEERVQHILVAIVGAEEALQNGALVVVEQERLRVRILPMQS